jgi:serine/threonine protein phosphatase PrpC
MSDMMDFTHIPGWQLDKGQQRENNEDSLRALKIDTSTLSSKRSIGIYVVADGVGGEVGGEVASQLAVETVMDELMNRINEYATAEQVQQWLADAAIKAHNTILQRKKARETVGGTTLVMAAVLGNQVYIANIGDSRAYLLHEGQLRQVTQDHTVAQKFVDAGIITPEEAATHPLSHVLMQAVGNEDEGIIKPDLFTETVTSGDYVLLCSDGLYNMVSEQEIVQIVNDAETPHLASSLLTQAANRAGGVDNIAVIVVEIRQRA